MDYLEQAGSDDEVVDNEAFLRVHQDAERPSPRTTALSTLTTMRTMAISLKM